jgi:hypothetical protein
MLGQTPTAADSHVTFALRPLHHIHYRPLPIAARSHSHLELFTLERSVSISLAQQQDQQQELRAALTEKLVAKVVDAKQTEVEKMVAGVAAKYGLAADYGQAEDTIKAVWAEQASDQSRHGMVLLLHVASYQRCPGSSHSDGSRCHCVHRATLCTRPCPLLLPCLTSCPCS